MVGFHVEFSQSMYSSKCPYSIAISCTSVTGPSVYWRSFWASASRVSVSWARASSESEEAARHMDKIIVLVIFSCDGEPTIPQVHYYHDNSAICARFCYSSGERFRSSCPAPIIIAVLPCGSSRAERLCDPSELRVRYLTHHRLGRALRSPTAGSAGSGRKPSRGISRQSVLIRRPAFPPTFSATALAVSAAIDCEHVDARGRELRRHP